MNEEKNLAHVLPHIPADVDEVILVDGHSTDGTVAEAKRLMPGILVVTQNGSGKGNALSCGFAMSTGDIIVMIDSGGSTDPREIPRFVDALVGGADFAKGSRYMTGGGSDDLTGMRSAGNTGLTRLVNVTFGTDYTDLCYGYMAFWRHALPSLSVNCSGFEVETQLTLRAARAGLRVVEVPSHEGSRVHGLSNLNAFRDGRRVLRTIIRERFSTTHDLNAPAWALLAGQLGFHHDEEAGETHRADRRDATERAVR